MIQAWLAIVAVGDLMSNDAKLGLVLGVAIVVVIGLVFFRAEPPLAVQAVTSNGVMTTSLPVNHAWTSVIAQGK